MKATRRTLTASMVLTLGLAGSIVLSGTASASQIITMSPHLEATSRALAPAHFILHKTSHGKMQPI
jgi:hypothetical protein